MDDGHNHAYSRPPTVEDILHLCQELNKAGARYILIGGLAVILHGYVRGTKDIDLLVDSSDENIRNLKKAMSTLPDNAIALIGDDEVRQYQVVRIGDEVTIDLMERACGINYEEAIKQVEWMEIEGVKIPVASKELLIRTKDTVRHSDKNDIEFLKAMIEQEKKFSKT